MPRQRIVLSLDAERDLDLLFDCIAHDSGVARAEAILRRIEETLDLIADMPRIGRVRYDVDGEPRTFSIWPWIIVYEPQSTGRGIVVYHPRNTHDKEVLDELTATMTGQGITVFEPVHHSTAFDKAVAEGRAALELWPQTPGVQTYQRIVECTPSYGPQI